MGFSPPACTTLGCSPGVRNSLITFCSQLTLLVLLWGTCTLMALLL